MRNVSAGCVILLFVVILVILVAIALPMQTRSDHKEIHQWAANNNQQIVNIERHYFSIGPFWYRGKNDRIYEVNLANGQTHWFKMNILMTDIKEQK